MRENDGKGGSTGYFVDALQSATKVYNGLIWNLREQYKETGKSPISKSNLNKIMKDLPHCKEYYSLSAQATRDEVIQAYKSYFALHKNGDTKARQPGFRRKTTCSNLRYYNGYGFKLEGNKLTLSFGLHKTRGVKNVEVEIQYRSDIEYTRVINVLITYDKKHGLQAHLVVDTKAVTALGKRVVAVDLGETQLLTAMLGDGRTLMYNGREIKSLRRYWQKVRRKVKPPVEGQKKSRRYSQIDVKESRQVSHRLHIITRDFVNGCYKAGVKTIVMGDLTGIRSSINYGKATNQRLHAWSFAKVVEMIRYKADMLGMKVVQISEAYTSKTCHKCTTCAKSNRISRGYTKCSCGWKAHADVNAAANIFEKFTNLSPLNRRCGAVEAPAVMPLRNNWHTVCEPRCLPL